MTREAAVSRILARRIAAFLRERPEAAARGPLLVGVSGGPDSAALLHALARLRGDLGFTVHAAHLNHQLRGGESDADAAYVADLCVALGVPLALASVDVHEHRKRHRLSLEEAARVCRHRFFAETAAAAGAPAVFLGHTANDQAETVLMHLLRGASLEGLRGMEALSRIRVPGLPPLLIARPLLATWRRETEAYCAEHRLHPRVDSSNLVPEFTRNRVRLELLPRLRRFNPSIEKALLRLAESAAEAADFLGAEARRARQRLQAPGAGGLAFKRRELRQLAPAVASRALRAALEEVLSARQGVTSAHIRKMLQAASGPAGKTIHLPGEIEFSVDYDLVFLRRRGRPAADLPALPRESVALQVPGATRRPGWTVRAEVLARADLERQGVRLDAAPPNALMAYLDGSLAGQPLWVRSRQAGDRFQPLGMPAAKKLQDFMVDGKIARSLRDAIPLVCDAQGILWVAGYRLGERARVRPGSDTVLRLEFQIES